MPDTPESVRAGATRDVWPAAAPWVEAALRESEILALRPVYDSSNYVYLATLAHPRHGPGLGIYKPREGEMPLYDFPDGTLHRREAAAYEFSRLLGWQVVPPTVVRDGPRGMGSLQAAVLHQPAEHYFVLRDDPGHHQSLVRIAAFDLAANNADRKGGHLLLDPDGHIWGIDQGLCFHEVPKLRTVVWDFAGSELAPAWVDDLRRTRDALTASAPEAGPLIELLDPREVDALLLRCTALIEEPVLPQMYPWRCWPWPLV